MKPQADAKCHLVKTRMSPLPECSFRRAFGVLEPLDICFFIIMSAVPALMPNQEGF